MNLNVISSSFCYQGKAVIDGAEEVDYVNYNQPFTKAQASKKNCHNV